MKITEIALKNVRKFSERARILGLGEGLNVLTAPNERGKSTFFDALHAAFFLSHKSGAKPVQDLKSRVGGDPEVTVGFEIDGVSLQIRKVFSKAKAGGAWLRRDGVLVAQHVEAEEMLARLLGSGQGRGPSGLLWVRQGVVGMEPYGEESDARRDIMQSVAGEVDAMTGGRRMEVALRRCATFLDANLTSRGAKKGSPYQAALDEVVRLGVAKAELVEVVRRLEGDLDQRREVRGQIRDLIDPVAKDAREARLKDAEAAFLAAQETGRKVEAARSAVASLGLRVNEVKRRKERLEEAIEERDQARSAEKDAKTEENKAKTEHQVAQASFNEKKSSYEKHAAASEAASTTVRKALAAEGARVTEAKRMDLTDRIARAGEIRERLEVIAATLAPLPTHEVLRAVEDAQADLWRAERARDAEAPSFIVHYDAAGRVHRDGVEVLEGVAQPVPHGAILHLDGIGTLDLRPGAGGADVAVAEAAKALLLALNRAGGASVEAVRASAQQRAKLEDERRGLEIERDVKAPNGIESLRRELAELPETVEGVEGLPNRADAEELETVAREAAEAAAAEMEGARVVLDGATCLLAKTSARADEAARRLTAAFAGLAYVEDVEAALAEASEEKAVMEGELEAAREKLVALASDAPDLEAAEVARDRARSVVDGAREGLAALRIDLARLEERIAQAGQEAPEERLTLVSEELDAATSRLEVIEFEIRVYTRLRDALESAQRKSREKYVQPVLEELVPLLRMIWPDAEPTVDAETGLITAITRRNVEENFDILSGGTQEQLTLMVRLAFARMLAQDGRAAPVILDDAIVYTDDDRIEQMFDALTRQARDLQIIVLSCRQRAFRELGGRQLTIVEGEAA